jgi:transmembrane sensor
MSADPSNTSVKAMKRRELDEAASDWIIAHDRGLTPERKRDFENWLNADPSHRAVWAEAQSAWKRLDRMPELVPTVVAEPQRRQAWPAWAAAAAVLAFGLFLWTRKEPTAAPQHDAGIVRVSPRQLTLPDGSIVELNSGSVVKKAFTAAERRIFLIHGEAHFAVAHNPNRPFIVEAGGVGVRAVGTVFDVRLDASSVEILVTEGGVKVDSPTTASSMPQELPLLTAGQRAIVPLAQPDKATEITAISTDEIVRSLAWRGLRLRFQDLPLSQVGAEFNRYNKTQLQVDTDASDVLVAGTFRADNVDVFVHFLEDGFHVSADRRSDGVIELRKAH